MRQNPSVLQYETVNNSPPARNLTPQDFSFVVALGDPNTYEPYSNSAIYEVEFYNYKLKNGVLSDSRKLKSGPCSIENFKGVNLNIFEEGFPFEKYQCIDKSENLEMKGMLSGAEISYINIKIKKCKQNCVNETEFANMLDGCPVYFYYVDKYFDSSDFKNPTKYYFNQYFNTASQRFFKGINVEIKHLNFIDDTGLFFEEKQVKSEIVVDNINPTMDFRNVVDFLEIIINFSQKVTNISRNYVRFQQIVANVGGLLNSINIFTGIILEFITRYMYYNYCTEKIFIQESKKNQTNLKLEHISEFKSGTCSNNLLQSQPNMISVNLNKNGLISKHNSKIIKINPTKTDKTDSKIKSQVSPQKNSKLYQEAKNYIESTFDYENLILIFKEVECIKRLVLSKPELIKFNKFIQNTKSTATILLNKKLHQNTNIQLEASDRNFISDKLENLLNL